MLGRLNIAILILILSVSILEAKDLFPGDRITVDRGYISAAVNYHENIPGVKYSGLVMLSEKTGMGLEYSEYKNVKDSKWSYIGSFVESQMNSDDLVHPYVRLAVGAGRYDNQSIWYVAPEFGVEVNIWRGLHFYSGFSYFIAPVYEGKVFRNDKGNHSGPVFTVGIKFGSF